MADLGDGPDGDPIPGETEAEKFKRIARRAEKEKATTVKAVAAERDSERQRAAKFEADLGTERQARTAAEAMVTKYQVAESKGLPLSAAEFFKGSTKEEIEASAQRYIEVNSIPGVQQQGGGADSSSQLDDLVGYVNRNRY